MNKLNLAKYSLVIFSLVGFGASIASAQSAHHDVLDARAAKADIIRLKAERRIAKRQHNWGKVAQDNRLIAKDRRFIHKDVRQAIIKRS